MQYPDVCPDLSAVLGGTPGAANGSGCPPVDGGTPAQDSGVVDAGTD
jgi:hypothetical protein